jgi:tol-pal system protein YbgF
MRQNTIFCVLMCLLVAGSSVRAGTKEEIMRLQSDVLALQTQFREFEKTFTEKTDGLKSLVVQLNDQVAKSNVLLERVSKTLESQASGSRATDQTLTEEIRKLSARLDDTVTGISVLAQQIADLKVQAKPLAPSTAGQSIQSVFDQAYLDYVNGNYDLAVQGFAAYLSSDPGGEKAPAAHFYVGDSYSRLGKLQEAIAAFTRVINDYPQSPQVASALFKRGRAELAMKESDNAIADFRAVIEKFPEAPEAEPAKEELRKMGVSQKKPAAPATRRKTR